MKRKGELKGSVNIAIASRIHQHRHHQPSSKHHQLQARVDTGSARHNEAAQSFIKKLVESPASFVSGTT
ncbi:Protein of unknown function [Pyronema omphalodes CBS 100304]|uniref:Uncharacterized protein n=1 Tax=Pyronema omphalodes (strain CBS 100304) TaxID=1076935 RepID=U4L449_PYROM|nr:Protein of unknown function [Pyronema omphalodes CBS 100304]